MDDQPQTQIIRRPKAAIALSSINICHLRNPLVVAWWSLAFPGFGHLRLACWVKGVFLFTGELLINTYSHINLAILYSFTGDLVRASQVLNSDLLLLYCGLLVFGIWDSYRVTLEINKISVLADHENNAIIPAVITPIGVNVLDKRNPWVAIAWSVVLPGAGHLYCMSIVMAMFMMIGGLVIIYFSHLIPAIALTAIGQFAQAQAIVDWQWLLNFPSFYIFGIYDAYVKAVEINKLFEKEQAQFLKNNYQKLSFEMPL